MLVSGRVDIYEFKDLDLAMTPWFDCCSFAGQAFCNTDVMTVTPNIRFITWCTPVDFDGCIQMKSDIAAGEKVENEKENISGLVPCIVTLSQIC